MDTVEETKAAKTQERIIYLDRIDPHPLNRKFERKGAKWEALVASVRVHGVISMPGLRYMEDCRYQSIWGHRRIAAAKFLGVEKLKCTVREMTDREALEFLIIENLEKEDVDPVEEAGLIRAGIAEGIEPEVLAHRLSRTVEWIRTRQGLLDLGDEVCAAVRLPREDPRHLNMGTVEELLRVDPEDREEAVQLVLHPQYEDGTLSSRKAALVIRDHILEPKRLKLEWEKDAPALVKAWRKRLHEHLTKDQRLELLVEAVAWDKREAIRFAKDAEDVLKNDPLANLPVLDGSERWLHLAIESGIPVWIVPARETQEESRAVVDEKLLRLAQKTKEEIGAVHWLRTKPVRMAVVVEDEEEEEGDEEAGRDAPATDCGGTPQPQADTRVADALHVLEGQGERGYQEEEKAETVIEQSFERTMWMDVTPVMRMMAWAEEQLKLPEEEMADVYPEGLIPQWMDDWCFAAEDVKAACDWVLSLKK